MADQPIVCTLAPEQMRGRMSLIDTLAADALLGSEPIPAGMRARFRDEPEIERRVRDLVALESQCCGLPAL